MPADIDDAPAPRAARSTCLGRHLIADFWSARRCDDPDFVERALAKAAHDAGATLLSVKTHHFGGAGGVTSVALLAESHISIHSWPEHDYAALDIFVCGDADPFRALESLVASFAPARVEHQHIGRGRRDHG